MPGTCTPVLSGPRDRLTPGHGECIAFRETSPCSFHFLSPLPPSQPLSPLSAMQVKCARHCLLDAVSQAYSQVPFTLSDTDRAKPQRWRLHRQLGSRTQSWHTRLVQRELLG